MVGTRNKPHAKVLDDIAAAKRAWEDKCAEYDARARVAKENAKTEVLELVKEALEAGQPLNRVTQDGLGYAGIQSLAYFVGAKKANAEYIRLAIDEMLGLASEFNGTDSASSASGQAAARPDGLTFKSEITGPFKNTTRYTITDSAGMEYEVNVWNINGVRSCAHSEFYGSPDFDKIEAYLLEKHGSIEWDD